MKRDIATAFGLLILRVAVGSMMLIGHGWGKLQAFGQMAGKFPDPLGIGNQLSMISAIGAEAGCSTLLILGLGTRIAAIPLAFTMCVALFIVHGADPWQKKELAALYLAAYVTLIGTGGGRFSVDHWILKRRSPHA
jgi:putative oxidoreductase